MKRIILLFVFMLSLSSCGVVNELLTYNAIYNRPYYRPAYYHPPRYSQKIGIYKHYQKPSSHYRFRN